MKKVVFWLLALIMLAAALISFPNFSFLLFLLAAVLTLPLKPLRQRIQVLFPTALLQCTLVGLLLFFGVISLPGQRLPPLLPEETPGSEVYLPRPGQLQETAAAETDIPSELEIHFLDVGQADAALVCCDGHWMLIDGGSKVDSRFLYSYLKSYDISRLDYLFATHPHGDHIGGIPGALRYASADTVFCNVTAYDSEEFRDFAKYLESQKIPITIPTAGMTLPLGSAQVQILGPIIPEETENNNCLVLRITFGDTAFLFAADMEAAEEQSLLDSGWTLESNVLKVGHHGSSDASSEAFLKAVCPEYAILSVGAGNSYQHPHDAVLERLHQIGANLYRTDQHGTIRCTSNGKRVTITPTIPDIPETTAPSPNIPANPFGAAVPASSEGSFVLNISSKKFHYPGCDSVAKMNPKNRQDYTGSRETVISQGYVPCNFCKP